MTSETVIPEWNRMYGRWKFPEILCLTMTRNALHISSQTLRSRIVSIAWHLVHTTWWSKVRRRGLCRLLKRILKQVDSFLALMIYRVTPISATGFDSAQLLMGWSIHTRLLTIPTLCVLDGLVRNQTDAKAKKNYEFQYNRTWYSLNEV